MTPDVTLDANVLVGLLDPGDSLHASCNALIDELGERGAGFVLLDFIVEETLSVLCRRSQQRKEHPPNLQSAIATVREWYERGRVRESVPDLAGSFESLLDIISDFSGALNMNDAKLVFLQRTEKIGLIGTFDHKLALVQGLLCVRPSP